VTALLVGGLLAGCSGAGDSDRVGASRESGSAGASSSASSTDPAASSGAPGASSEAGNPTGSAKPNNPDPEGRSAAPALTAGPGEIVVTGDVEDGVEPGCVVLRSSNGTYVLIGGDRQRLGAGGRMTVRGRAEEGMMTTCMQGTPLRVIEAQAN